MAASKYQFLYAPVLARTGNICVYSHKRKPHRVRMIWEETWREETTCKTST